MGAISAIRKDDHVLTSYREHGHAIAKGVSSEAVMAELFGKAGGCSRGKGGSMHMFDREVNFMGGHAIVGGQIPLATGVAFASKYLGTDQVTLSFFGEAAVNQGVFHESLNMAQLWKPLVFVAKTISTAWAPLERAMSQHHIARRLTRLNWPANLSTAWMLAVRAATNARSNGPATLPTLIEVRTHRFMVTDVRPGQLSHARGIERHQERTPQTLLSYLCWKPGPSPKANCRRWTTTRDG